MSILSQLGQYVRNMPWGQYLQKAKHFLSKKENRDALVGVGIALKTAKEGVSLAREVQGNRAQRQRQVQSQAHAQSAQALVEAQARTDAALQRGFGKMIASSQQMNVAMSQGFEGMARGLGQVASRIQNLHVDVVGGMQQIDRSIQSMHADMNQGMQQIDHSIQSMHADMSQGMQQIAGNIEALQADFNWGLGAILWQLEMQQETLNAILATLQAPLDTQAKELRKRAEFAYQQGWYDEALKDFLESEKKNYQDFTVHQAIANLYLYHQQSANLVEARKYYLQAAKYAKAHSKYHAALAYMYAGFVCYLQRDDDKAISYAYQAIQQYPTLTEAVYNHAKFAAAGRRPAKVIIRKLRHAIESDRNYAIKARLDADFEPYEAELTQLIADLRTEAQQKVAPKWTRLQVYLNDYAIPPSSRQQIQLLRAESQTLMAQHTYFAYLDAPAKIEQCQQLFDSLNLPVRDYFVRQTRQSITSLRTEMAEYAIPPALKQQLEREITEAEQLIGTITTLEQARQAEQIVRRCQEQWKKMAAGGQERAVLKEHTNVVNAIAFSPDGKVLASGSNDGTVRLWDVANGQQQTTLQHDDIVITIGFSPNGRTLASGSHDGNVRLWDVISTQQQGTLQHGYQVFGITFSPDGKMLAIACNIYVCLWDVASQQHQANLQGHSNQVLAVAFSPDGKMLASASADQTVRLWDVVSRQPQTKLTKHTADVNAVAFSPDGRTLASASADKTVRLWDVVSGHEQKVLTISPSSANEVVPAAAPQPPTDSRLPPPVAPTPPIGASIGKLHGARVGRAVSRVASVRRAEVVGQIVNLPPPSTVRRAAVQSPHPKCPIAFSPDGKTLASGFDDGTIRLWNVASGQEGMVLNGHGSGVTAVAFSPDGTVLASASADKTVRLWSLVGRKRDGGG